MQREDCSLRVCSSHLAKNPSLHPSKTKKMSFKTPHSWCLCFLHHRAFPLRHIEVLTLQADRLADERPAVTQKHKELTSHVIALMMRLHPYQKIILIRSTEEMGARCKGQRLKVIPDLQVKIMGLNIGLYCTF